MLLKKFVSACLLPFPFGLGLVLAGLLLLWVSQRQRLGRVIASLGALVLLLGGYDVGTTVLLRPLEHQYPALSAAALAQLDPPPAAVVVLGSGYRADPTLPPNARLDSVGLARLVEGVRLWRLRPEMKLVVSGGFGQAGALADTAEILGVPRAKLALESESWDTADEATMLRPFLGQAPFLLVTSAAHMRRSMALCRKQGLRPIAAPTDFIDHKWSFTLVNLIPGVGGLAKADHALHEWIGLAWSRLRGAV